ncbi:MAG: alcohol dehydrogenase catalytic domain-containing protein [Polyangiaceae bacterium]
MTALSLPQGRRVVVARYGETPLEAIDQATSIEPMPAPDPAALAPTDVLIAIKSAQVGWVDLLMTSGQYQHMPDPPYCPGLEYAGEVAWAGPEVTALRPGDPVLVDGFQAGPRSLGAYRQYGGFATYGVAPASAVLKVPGTLTLDEAACLLGNYETAYHCLVTRGQLKEERPSSSAPPAPPASPPSTSPKLLLGAKVIATGAPTRSSQG